MYVCIYSCMHIPTYTCILKNIDAHMYVCMYVCIRAYRHPHIHTSFVDACMYVYVLTLRRECIHANTHIYIHNVSSIYIYIYIYIKGWRSEIYPVIHRSNQVKPGRAPGYLPCDSQVKPGRAGYLPIYTTNVYSIDTSSVHAYTHIYMCICIYI